MVNAITSSKLQLITLGGVRVLAHGQDVTATLPVKGLGLLVYLARHAQPQPRERLAELFWPGRSTEQALGSLRTALTKMRPTIGWALHIGHSDIGLEANLDATTFEHLAPSPATLPEALALYQGEFMAGFLAADARDFEHWVMAEAENLQAIFIQAAHQQLQRLQRENQLEAAILSTRTALTHAPLCEDFHRTLIHLYHLTGERAAALRQYQTCRTVLWEELAVEPDARTQALFAQITATTTAPTMMVMRPPHLSLPARMTSFIGRSEICATVEGLLHQHRLLTICATGGAGKTRLALEVAHQVLDQFKDGVYFIDLTRVRHADEVPSAVAHAVGVQQDSFIEALTGYELLLVLDNVEHVIESAAFIAHLIEALPGLKILTTSREPLKLYGEQLFRLAALTLDESAQLFRERLRGVIPDFRRDEITDTHIEAICAQLEGLPLAIELAATRARTLSFDEIRHGLAHRLDLLTSDLRNLPRRQRAMLNTIEWSYTLLTPEQAALFRSLAVFRGGWTRHALSQISPHAAQLDDLVDKSLIRRAAADTPRYSLLETVREYAVALLKQSGEEMSLQTTHARWVMHFAEDATYRLKTSEHATALADIRDEDPNIHAALDFLRPRAELLEVYARILSALGWLWHVRPSYRAVYEHFQHAIAQSEALSPALRADLWSAGGHIASMLGHYDLSIAWQTTALSLYEALGDTDGQAYVHFYLTGIKIQAESNKNTLHELRHYAQTRQDDYLLAKIDLNLGWTLYHTNDFEAAEVILREGLAISEANGYQLLLTAFCINLASLCSTRQTTQTEAFGLLERARLLSQSDGNLYLEAICTLDQSQLLYTQGQIDEAAHYLRQVAPLVQKVNIAFIRLGYRFWSAVLAVEVGDWAMVRYHYEQCLRVINPDDSNMSLTIIDIFLYLALLLSARRHFVAAAQVFGGMMAFQAEIECAYSSHQQTWFQRTTEALTAWESPTERAIAQSEGENFGMERLILFARESLSLLT